MSRKRRVITVGKEINDYIRALDKFTDATDGMIRWTIYPGAEKITDKIREAIEELPEIDRKMRESKGSSVKRPKDKRKRTGKIPKGVTQVEREGLLDGLGIAGMRFDDDWLNAKVGMDGYNKHVTAKWPKGHPNAMIARSVESGTSFRKKTPFIAPTAKKYKEQAQKDMAAEFDRQVERNWDFK